VSQSISLVGEAVLLDGAKDFAPGWVVVESGRIKATGQGAFPGRADRIVTGRLAPGFVDVHAHGGGGAVFAQGADAAATVLATHLIHGTTTMVASLVTAGWEDLMAQVAALRPLVERGDLAGVHLEGPWLAPSKKGAHRLSLLAPPTAAAVADVVANEDVVRQVTIAPELPFALEAIAALADAGIVAAVGHTAADLPTTRRAVAAGARGATHLFNARPPLLHRAPGPVLALLDDPRVFCELVADTHHVDITLVVAILRLLGPRGVLVTDAMAAADLGDGQYTLGGLPVQVAGGVARLSDDPAHNIAGSTITLSDAVANCVAAGLPLADAVRAATRYPAEHLGLPDVGRLATGFWADLVELDASGRVLSVMRHGDVVREPPTRPGR
jgi:N-acetylglucosamine-6-phosphate deacetylase